MSNNKTIETLKFEPLHEDNIKAVHQMCNKNVQFLNHSFQTFKTTTIESKSFDPELTIVASELEGNIIAFFMVVFRRSQVFRKKRKVAVLKFFVVSKEWRYKGLGTKIYLELYKRIKNSENRCFRMKYEVMSSVPDYWLPGLDPRHTEAFFFLEKQGFKKKGERINLCVSLEEISDKKPLDHVNGYEISRATSNDKKELIPLKFMSKKYQLSFWPDEVGISLHKDLITTFIARESMSGRIIGWASHSVHFPGSFGPTGVDKRERGNKLGTILLNWCLWDMKQMGLKQATILWVEIETIYFYLKSRGAHISEIYWVMNKRIK